MLYSSVTYCLIRRFLWLLFIFCISVWQVTNEIPFLKLNSASFLSHTHKGWIIICFLDSSCTLSSFITFPSSVINALALWPRLLTAHYRDKCLGLIISSPRMLLYLQLKSTLKAVLRYYIVFRFYIVFDFLHSFGSLWPSRMVFLELLRQLLL